MVGFDRLHILAAAPGVEDDRAKLDYLAALIVDIRRHSSQHSQRSLPGCRKVLARLLRRLLYLYAGAAVT